VVLYNCRKPVALFVVLLLFATPWFASAATASEQPPVTNSDILNIPASAFQAKPNNTASTASFFVVPLKFLKADDAKSLLSLLVPEDKMRIETVNNTIIIRCDEYEREQIEQLLSVVDRPPLQIMFEVEAVEVSRDDLKNVGFDWGSVMSLPGAVPYDSSSSFRIGLGIPNHPEYGLNLSGTLHTLIENKKGKLLASPRIASLNGNTAQIMIGDKLAVESTSIVSGSSIVSTTYVEVGIKLEVTPFVNDDGTITIHVKPEVSNKTDTTKNGNPNIRTRQAETTLRVKNGETIVIGGLLQQQETSDRFKFPLLGDIPLVGQLFRTSTKEKTQTELVILITPKVITT